MPDIRVRLRGGPQDGQELTVSADSSGKPIPRITLPARARNPEAVPPRLIYERARKNGDGTWEFRYTGAET